MRFRSGRSFPPLSEETRKTKRNLLIASCAVILAWAFAVEITKLSFSGLELSVAGDALFGVLLIGVAYFLLVWAIYVWDDWRVWNSPTKLAERRIKQFEKQASAIVEDTARIREVLIQWPSSIEPQEADRLSRAVLERPVYADGHEETVEELIARLESEGLPMPEDRETRNGSVVVIGRGAGARTQQAQWCVETMLEIAKQHAAYRRDILHMYVRPELMGDLGALFTKSIVDVAIPALLALVALCAGLAGLLDWGPWWLENDPAPVQSALIWGFV